MATSVVKHQQQVRAFYGDAAVRELPPLPPKRKRTKRQAA